MRSTTLFLLTIFVALSLPFAPRAEAASTADDLAKICKGYTGNPTETRKFPSSDFETGAMTPDMMRTYLKRKVLCPSACYNETITLSIQQEGLSGYMQIDTVGTDQCKSPKPKSADIQSIFTKLASPNEDRNCNNNKGQPAVVIRSIKANDFMISMGGDKIPSVFQRPRVDGPRTRCDSNMSTVIDQFATGNFELGFKQSQSLSAPTDGIGMPASTNVPSNDTGRLINAFQAAGISKDDAEAAIAKDPIAAEKYLAGMASSDKEMVEENAKKLGLSSDLSDVKSIEVAKALGTPPPGEQPESGATRSDPHAFGGAPAEQQQQQRGPCGIDDPFVGGLAKIESNCGRNTYSATTNVVGPFQFMCPTWATYTARTGNSQYSDCRYAADPDISTKVMMDVKNQIYLPQYGDTINQLGIKENAGLYMPHLLGEGGANKFFGVYSQYGGNTSAEVLRGYLGNAAIDNNRSLFYAGSTPRTLDGVLAEVDKRMTGTSYVGGLATAGSPFGGFNGYYAGGPVSYGVSPSPFASVTPVGYGYSYGSPYGYSGYPYSPTVSTGQPVSTGLPVSTGPVTQTPVSQQLIQGTQTGGGTLPTGGTVPAAATLIVQPNPVMKGSPVAISWSSVGMRSDTPCQLFVGSTFLAQANEGTRSFDTKTAASGTNLVFVLQCFSALDGSKIQRTATSTVQ